MRAPLNERVNKATRLNVNEQGRYGTLLTEATNHNRLDLVQRLLELGADPNIGAITVLHYAVAGGRHAIASLLLAHGAHVNAQFSTSSPLDWAINHKTRECAWVCLDYGATIQQHHLTHYWFASAIKHRKMVGSMASILLAIRSKLAPKDVLYTIAKHLWSMRQKL